MIAVGETKLHTRRVFVVQNLDLGVTHFSVLDSHPITSQAVTRAGDRRGQEVKQPGKKPEAILQNKTKNKICEHIVKARVASSAR